MAKIKVGIVEDELIIAQGITNALTELGYDTTEPAISYTEALGMIVEEQPDILLIDIVLKGHKDGIDLAQKVKEDFNIPYIFLTANSDKATVERAKQLFPPAYLVKPFNKKELYTSIEICLNNFAGKQEKVQDEGDDNNYLIKDCVFIKQGKNFQKIQVADILYLESDNIYVHVYTASNKLLVRSSLQKYLELIGSPSFLQIHKCFAINTQHIEALNAESVFINKSELPIGRVYKENLLRSLKIG